MSWYYRGACIASYCCIRLQRLLIGYREINIESITERWEGLFFNTVVSTRGFQRSNYTALILQLERWFTIEKDGSRRKWWKARRRRNEGQAYVYRWRNGLHEERCWPCWRCSCYCRHYDWQWNFRFSEVCPLVQWFSWNGACCLGAVWCSSNVWRLIVCWTGNHDSKIWRRKYVSSGELWGLTFFYVYLDCLYRD